MRTGCKPNDRYLLENKLCFLIVLSSLSHSSFPWYREKKKLFYRWIQRQRSATISQRQAFVTATGERVFIGSTFNCLKPGGFLHPVNVSVGTVIAVGLEETQHLKTRRLRPGDILEIFDGCGNVGHATLLEYVQGKTQRASLRVDSWCSNSSESEGHNSQCVTVGVSMPKGKRADWLVEKLTEVGVHCVIPLHFARSNIRADNDDANRYQRWMRIAVSACKQCGRSEVINIGQDQSFVELLSHQKNRPTWDIMFIASRNAPPLNLTSLWCFRKVLVIVDLKEA
eukprot:jgi/Galph1/812/GphlegSOOS_G5584.1